MNIHRLHPHDCVGSNIFIHSRGQEYAPQRQLCVLYREKMRQLMKHGLAIVIVLVIQAFTSITTDFNATCKTRWRLARIRLAICIIKIADH